MGKRILYCVLNWGLGHASRSIPIIQFLQKKHTVMVASNGDALHLMKQELENVEYFDLPAYNAHYAKNKHLFATKILQQIPHFLQVIKKEKKMVNELVNQQKIDLIISDNRYGCYHENVPSYFIGHQLNLLFPASRFVEKLVNKQHNKMLNNFDEILVPDAENGIVSGDLSKKKWKNVNYIGLFSRFSKKKIKQKYALAIVLSGPEPQRTILEVKLAEQLTSFKEPIVFVRGIRNAKKMKNPSKNSASKLIDFCTAEDLNEILNQSEKVICRSGYSSIMDLLTVGKSAILIPTPGQPEQEFLAKKLEKMKWFYMQNQQDFDLENSLVQSKSYHPKIEGTAVNNFEILDKLF